MNKAKLSERLLKSSEVEEMVGLSRPTLWRRQQLGTFPSRLQVGPNSVRWKESEILEWIQNCQRVNGGDDE